MKTISHTMALCLFLCISCSPDAPSGTVSFYHYAPGALAEGMENLGKLFHDSQSRLRISMVPVDHESFKSSILNSITLGTPPELFSHWAGARTQALVPYLEPLDELWASEGWDDFFPPRLVESSVRYNGHKYLLPMTLQYIGFFYNKQVFTREGLSPPKDWEDLLRACEILRTRKIIPLALGAKDRWPAQFWFDYLLLRTAGPGFRDDLIAGTQPLDSPEVRQVFLLWKTLLDREYFNPEPEMESWDTFAASAVAEGRAAMTLNGTWTLGLFQALYPAEAANIGFFPFPAVEDRPQAALGYVEGVLVPRGSLNPAGAREALKFLAGKEAQLHMSRTFGSIPPRSLDLADDAPEIQNEIRREVDAAQVWATNLDLSVPAPAAEAALNLFREFLRFPDRYPQLLAGASQEFSQAYLP